MREEHQSFDITVIGGGLAGVCAAVAAARLGQRVALVHNRPVLGGNSSSEVRVWVCGGTAHGVNRYARETGIMGEMLVENQYRNPLGNPYLWDLVVLETVRSEPNLSLFLNTDVYEVDVYEDGGQQVIRSVTGWMTGSERRIMFSSDIFLDCTGDGLVGFLAGARYRIGREAKSEFQEDWAPLVSDDITLGSTLLFYTKDAGEPVRFVAPSFARDIEAAGLPMRRVIQSGDNGCHYWWIEWGGELDTLHDNERIRDELWAVIYGIWDYIKNSGKFGAERLTLEWVGSVPGKREYRRFIGDYMLTQNDIVAQTPFNDRVAYGGWSIDLHPPQGMYAKERGSKHRHADGNYHIPFRALYSVNVRNLLFAGRNISATHVAFGTTRVMGTCAVMGEAAGTGAALCIQYGIRPRELYRFRLRELQLTLLRQDAAVLGLCVPDEQNQAQSAQVRASSWMSRIEITESAGMQRLERDAAVLLPFWTRSGKLELLVDVEEATKLELEVWSTGRPENYIPIHCECKAAAEVQPGQKQWAAFEIPWEPEEAQNAFVIIRSNPAVALHWSDAAFTGVLSFEWDEAAARKDSGFDQPVVIWSQRGRVRRPFCVRSDAGTAYAPQNIIDGYNRPYGGPHSWVSERMKDGAEEWIALEWPKLQSVREIQVIFNDDVNEDLINLHHHRTPFETIPELVADYRLEARCRGSWTLLFHEAGNRKRRRVHRLEVPVSTDAVRLVIERTNGALSAEVVAIRVYE
ncbi:FAD-dependent oxidoreductase [Paenibacillus sp. P96]|uniref:FAD-dependent oxidoreductase n=1 Tax=Paenibacillus zeirhizosphaerae TaxID=2987519 RepID=A0ABT9FT10_9BACL|nr:FAD-dependent oxidoreductase [Paenibacillus sp. P96]MDP4097825.1 FAD-dependent oxidoreductase [Paenibacillus sp. P96]